MKFKKKLCYLNHVFHVLHCSIIQSIITIIAHVFNCCQRDSNERYLEKITLVKDSTGLAPENPSKDDSCICLEDDLTAEVFCLAHRFSSVSRDGLVLVACIFVDILHVTADEDMFAFQFLYLLEKGWLFWTKLVLRKLVCFYRMVGLARTAVILITQN